MSFLLSNKSSLIILICDEILLFSHSFVSTFFLKVGYLKVRGVMLDCINCSAYKSMNVAANTTHLKL